MADPVVIQDLHKVYHPDDPELSVRAVDGISFSIPAADAVAIIGASGCGKSTLLNILGCLDRPTSGTYLLEGEDVASLHEDELARLRNRHIGFVFQSFNLLPRMTAEENVALPLLYSGAANAAKLARDALGRVGLADRSTHVPNELSGGQKQRVAIARAIVTRPSILLCDEPTGALDSQTGDDVLRLIQDLNRDGTTLIMVTHDLQVARRLDRALHMVDGRIEQDGKASEVVDHFVAELASAAGAEA